MKHKKLMLIAILFVSAILATSAVAQIKDSRIFKFLGKQSGDWGSWAAVSAIITALTAFIVAFGIDLILMNPTVSGPDANPAIANAVNSFLYLLIPFYIIAFVITGIYFLFSQSPSGRAKTKSMFFKLIISMGAVFIALPLFQLLLDISQGIAQLIFSIGGDYVSIEKVFGSTTALSTVLSAIFLPVPSGKLIAFVLLLFGMLTLIAIILLLVMRYLLVVLAAIIFPFILFLWLFDFPYMRHTGAKLMHHAIVWIFVPVVTATVVVITSVIAGGFYSQCEWSKLIILDSDCWLSYFAGIAATFLILAAPLMMYGLMAWVGAGILFFGWTAMAAPLTLAGGESAVGLRYFGFPGADAVLRIPGVENNLNKFFGLAPLYGQDGRILGMTTAIKGFAQGEVPLGTPLIARILRKPRYTEGVSTPVAEATLYGRKWTYPLFDPKKEYAAWYNPYHPRTVIPKLAPLAVVAAGGVLAGMGPLGVVTAGLKGLWYEPGASFPLEANIPVPGGKIRVLAPEGYARSFGPDNVLKLSPAAFKEYYPEEFNNLLRTDPRRLAEAMKVKPEELPHAPMPPPQVPEEAAEKKRRDAQEEFEREMGRIEERRRTAMDIAEGSPKSERMADGRYGRERMQAQMKRDREMEGINRELERYRRREIKERVPVERRTPEEIAEKMRMEGIKDEKKIREELERARTYKEHPEMMAKEKGIGLMGLPHWLAFGQSARILSRQAQLMHGLKNFKVYTPTPPRMPDWTKKQWEAEEARKRQ